MEGSDDKTEKTPEKSETAVVDVAPSVPKAVAEPAPSTEPKQKRVRTERQKEATEKMKEKRWQDRQKAEEKAPQDEKDLAKATAMFMEMRQKEKELKKERVWEKQLGELLTTRMDDFEERMVDLFMQPIDHFMQHKKKRKQPPPGEEKPDKVEKTTKVDEEKPVEKELKNSPPKKRYSTVKNPFGR